MLRAWHRWREPLAVLLLVALTLLLLVRGIGVGQAIAAGTLDMAWGGIPGGDDLLLLVAAAAVLWCATSMSDRNAAVPDRDEAVSRNGAVPDRDRAADDQDGVREPAGASPHARGIAVVGLLIVGLTVLGWLALSVWGVVSLVRWPTPNSGYVLYVIEGILRLAIPAVALGMALLAVGQTGHVRRGRADSVRRELPTATPALPVGATSAQAAADEGSSSGGAVQVQEPARLPAAWTVDDAAGAVWLTADDAAQGRPGLSWPAEGETPPAVESSGTETGPGAETGPDAETEPETHTDAGPAGQSRIRPSVDDDDLR